MSQPSPLGPLALQWDAALTSTWAVDKFRAVIQAASVDNVQAQAVLTLLALGSNIMAAPELYGDAIDALDGNASVKLEHLKVNVGFAAGGTAEVLRQQSSGLSAFLLICALRLWQSSDNVGEILHDMALTSGILSHFPSSKYQICQTVEAVSSNALKLMPVDHLNHISGRIIQETVLDIPSGYDLYSEIDHNAVADLFVHVFTGLKNEETSKFAIKGMAAGIWIATILTWLLPKDTALVKDRKLLFGSSSARLLILLEKTEDGSWSYNEFDAEMSIINLIHIIPHSDPMRSSLKKESTPRSEYRNRAQIACFLPTQDVIMVGQVASAFLGHIVENGRLEYARSSTNGNTKDCRILDISTEWFITNYQNIMCSFGWTAGELETAATHQQNLTSELEAFKPQGDSAMDGPSSDDIMDFLGDYMQRQGCTETAECGHHVYTLAAEALAFTVLEVSKNTSDKKSSVASFNGQVVLQDHTSIGTQSISGLMSAFVSDRPVLLRQFRRGMLDLLLPYHQLNFKGTELIIESEGIVIYPKMLQSVSSKRSDALSLIAEPGQIRKDGVRYSLVVEWGKGLDTLPPVAYDEPRHVNFFTKHGYQQLIARRGFDDVQINCYSSSSRTKLTVRCFFTIFRDTPTPHISNSFSWLKEMELLAGATHLGAPEILTWQGEKKLAERMANELMSFDAIQWIHPLSGLLDDKVDRKQYLVRTNGSDIVRLQHLSQAAGFWENNPDNGLIWPVIQHEASLLACIKEANRVSPGPPGWLVIT